MGSILFAERGPKVLDELHRDGFKVFLDLKYHDIPNTVQGAVRRAFSWGVEMLTVHASGGMGMLEAAASEQKKNQKVIAVTVLTSLNDKDLRQIGYTSSVSKQVLRLAQLAKKSGVRGIVCSAQEVGLLSERFSKLSFITPGVRLEVGQDDQKRTGTIPKALNDGADYLVIGRALTGAKDWKLAWQKAKSSLDEISWKKRSR